MQEVPPKKSVLSCPLLFSYTLLDLFSRGFKQSVNWQGNSKLLSTNLPHLKRSNLYHSLLDQSSMKLGPNPTIGTKMCRFHLSVKVNNWQYPASNWRKFMWLQGLLQLLKLDERQFRAFWLQIRFHSTCFEWAVSKWMSL